MTAFVFRKSSHTGEAPGAECVEVADNVPGVVAVRDSKDPSGYQVLLSPVAWDAFTQHLRSP